MFPEDCNKCPAIGFRLKRDRSDLLQPRDSQRCLVVWMTLHLDETNFFPITDSTREFRQLHFDAYARGGSLAPVIQALKMRNLQHPSTISLLNIRIQLVNPII